MDKLGSHGEKTTEEQHIITDGDLVAVLEELNNDIISDEDVEKMVALWSGQNDTSADDVSIRL